MDAVLAFVPDEERVQFSAMTGQSLFYMGETNLEAQGAGGRRGGGRGARLVRPEAAAERRRAPDRVDGQGPADGQALTHEYRVEGPVRSC